MPKIKHIASLSNYSKVPTSSMVYWLKNFSIFDFAMLGDGYESGGRNKTHNNELFLRKWWEVFDLERWHPYANGGDFRRWYGNHIDLVDWSDSARNNYESHGGLYNKRFWGAFGLCWNLITSYKNSFRVKYDTFHYSSGSPTIISNDKHKDCIRLGFLNSEVGTYLIKAMNPTLNTTVNDVLTLPFNAGRDEEEIENMVDKNIILSKNDWDSYETSWDFKKHPLI